MKKMITLILAVLLICCFAGCTANANKEFPAITKNKVESISVWSQHSANSRELDATEMETFIELYNQSQYMGEGTGNGGTPEYGVSVNYKDGSAFYINEFNGRNLDFEVFVADTSGRNEIWCYANNPELLDYIAGLLNSNVCDN